MLLQLARRRGLIIWQFLFLLSGTFWLWAPHFNLRLSYRTSLISQYEAALQPYHLLFRATDVLAALLLLLICVVYFRLGKRLAAWLLLIIGLGMLADPLLPTTCRMVGHTCREYTSFAFVLHAVETCLTAAALFVLAVYDAWLRKRVVSVAFVVFQVAYGLLFVTHLANDWRFNTLTQFIYQSLVVVWLAWVCRDFLLAGSTPVSRREFTVIKNVAAGWAFINGIAAIVLSLAHIHLLGRIKGLYFAGNSAWLAQHGVVAGVVMIYLSRHLARGELRARQLFLFIAGIETLKYAVITPNAPLLLLYSVTFAALFVLRDNFRRGVIPLTYEVRLKDLYATVAAFMAATLISLVALDRDNRIARVANQAFDHFFDYVARSRFVPHSQLRSSLLAHTATAFIAAAAAAVAWILFRPYRPPKSATPQDTVAVQAALARYSASSEDFFKLWPADKEYFWNGEGPGQGFVAYKISGPIAFALADPIAADRQALLRAFVEWGQERRLRVCWLPVEAASLPMYKHAGLDTLMIGASALVKIQTFQNETSRDKWWRWQRNRAEKNGYAYGVSRPPHSAPFLQQLQTVSDAWLRKGGHKERGFALGYFDEAYLQRCNIHYLQDGGGRVLAFTNQVPSARPLATATIDLLRYTPEAQGAMPYLLSKTIQQLGEESDFQYFDLGFVPFAKVGSPLLTLAKTINAGRFSAKGLEQFKNKFDPEWHSVYLAYDGDLGDLALVTLQLEKVMQRS